MDKECTIYRTADFIGKRWTLPILLELHKGGGWKRYTLLKSRLGGITPKMLSERLKELEREGMVSKKTDAKNFPVKCEYSLTGSGKDFIGVIKEIKRWSLRWKFRNQKCKGTDCIHCEL